MLMRPTRKSRNHSTNWRQNWIVSFKKEAAVKADNKNPKRQQFDNNFILKTSNNKTYQCDLNLSES